MEIFSLHQLGNHDGVFKGKLQILLGKANLHLILQPSADNFGKLGQNFLGNNGGAVVIGLGKLGLSNGNSMSVQGGNGELIVDNFEIFSGHLLIILPRSGGKNSLINHVS